MRIMEIPNKRASFLTVRSRKISQKLKYYLKVHKNENFFGFDFEFCTISMLVMHK